MFVPATARSSVLQWGHSSKVAYHPVFSRSSDSGDHLSPDTREFFCGHSKSSHHAPAALLHPLPIPHHCWSHIAVCFATGIPPSEGSTRDSPSPFILWLSKITFSARDCKAPRHSYLQASRYSPGLRPGPQFTSQVWKAFCQALGASAILSSCYHPQTNGQMEWAS